jgi:hypothetical protein
MTIGSVKTRVNTILLERRNSILNFKEGMTGGGTVGTTEDSKLAEAIEDIFSMSEESLKLVITDPAGLKLFRTFLKKEHGEENLVFCTEIDKYKQIKFTDRSALKKKAEEIIATFVVDGAPQEVNLPGQTKKRILEMYQMKEITPNMFDSSQKSQLLLMQQDSFRLGGFMTPKLNVLQEVCDERHLETVFKEQKLSEVGSKIHKGQKINGCFDSSSQVFLNGRREAAHFQSDADFTPSC